MKKNHALRTALGVLLLVSGPAIAAEQLARLTIDVTVDGTKTWTRGEEYANSKISEQYHLVTHVQSIGEPTSVNTKDPQFAQNQMAIAAQVQQQVREAQGRAGNPVPKAPATQEEYLEQQKKLAEDMQKGQAACQGDMNCLMKLAQEYAMQSAMISYPPVEGAAPMADAGDEEDAPEDLRYLDYAGYEGCPGEIHIRINNTSEGALADVSGMIPFTQADTADYRGTELDLMMQCLASTLVYDFKAGKIYSDGFGHPAPRGSYRHWDRLHGETLNEEAQVPTTSAAWEWVAGSLKIADASGSATTTLPVPGANEGPASDGSNTSGEMTVSVKWAFEPL
jgi:hypothetical protein